MDAIYEILNISEPKSHMALQKYESHFTSLGISHLWNLYLEKGENHLIEYGRCNLCAKLFNPLLADLEGEICNREACNREKQSKLFDQDKHHYSRKRCFICNKKIPNNSNQAVCENSKCIELLTAHIGQSKRIVVATEAPERRNKQF